MTPGIDKETLDGINLNWFNRLSDDLGTNKFQFRPARRIELPKPNGKGMRPLGIASCFAARDKIVQGAILLVLEAIFEPTFSTHSHGFRPNKSCHSALGEIKRTFTSVNWFIEGDISKCFDTIDHKILIKALKERISDRGFIDLMHKALKAGYLSQGQFFETKIGTPQGSIVSPLLCNILLNKLDNQVVRMKLMFNKGDRHRINPIWRQYVRKGLQHLLIKMNISSRMHKDPNYKRLLYVRYADDFFIGIIGSYSDCLEIREEIRWFLEKHLSLKLSLEKTKITHARKGRAKFLGTEIFVTPLNKRPIMRIERGSQSYLSKIATRVQLHAPIKQLVTKLEEKGIVRHGGKPTRWAHMLPFDKYQIVNHFKTIWKGISNYYSFADNYGSLNRIFYILKHSCALTLASKLRLRTAKGTFRKFGKNLEIKSGDKVVAAFPNESLSKRRKFSNTKQQNPLTKIDKLTSATFRTRTNLEGACMVCKIHQI